MARLGIAVLALLAGCRTAATPDPVQPAPFLEVERPRDDFSDRVIPKEDPPEDPIIFFPEARESDG